MLSESYTRRLVNRFIKWILALSIFVVMVFPLWWIVNIVFSEPGIPVSINPRFYPTSLISGILKIHKVLTETSFFRAYVVSTVFVLLEITGVLIVTSPAAYEFALFKFPGKNVMFSIILLALMVPIAVILVPTYLLTVKLGWLNSMQGLVIPGVASAFGLFMLTQFMGEVPKALIEAATIDGAGHYGIFRRIVLPLSKNALTTLAILIFMKTWGNYIWPLVIAQRQEWYTVSQIVNLYNDPFSYTTVDVVMTANMLAAIPPLLFYLFFQRKIIEGVTLTGIKG